MAKTLRATASATALIFHAQLAMADNGQAWVVGPQPSSCGSFLQASGGESAVWTYWILGFWSGMNWEASDRSKGNTGSSTDSNGIVLSVKKLCQDDPAMAVSFVVAKLHKQLEDAGR